MDTPQPCVLLKSGELALKGRNRPLFVGALERNLRRLTADLGPLEIRHRGGVFIVTGSAPQETLVERCLALPGASVVQPAVRCERDPAAAADTAGALVRDRPGGTLARSAPPPRPPRRPPPRAGNPGGPPWAAGRGPPWGPPAARRDKRFPLRSIE